MIDQDCNRGQRTRAGSDRYFIYIYFSFFNPSRLCCECIRSVILSEMRVGLGRIRTTFNRLHINAVTNRSIIRSFAHIALIHSPLCIPLPKKYNNKACNNYTSIFIYHFISSTSSAYYFFLRIIYLVFFFPQHQPKNLNGFFQTLTDDKRILLMNHLVEKIYKQRGTKSICQLPVVILKNIYFNLLI